MAITISGSGIVEANIANGAVSSDKLATGIDATKLADGTVTSTELQYINTLASNAQTQIDGVGGGILVQQVHTQDGAVSTTTTTIPHDDTIPQNTEGGEFMTLAVTPTNSSNILEIDVTVNSSCSASNAWGCVGLFQDTTAGALSANHDHKGEGTGMHLTTLRYHMVAGTTSATTFKVRYGYSLSGTCTFNGQAGGRELGGVLASHITIKEFTV